RFADGAFGSAGAEAVKVRRARTQTRDVRLHRVVARFGGFDNASFHDVGELAVARDDPANRNGSRILRRDPRPDDDAMRLRIAGGDAVIEGHRPLIGRGLDALGAGGYGAGRSSKRSAACPIPFRHGVPPLRHFWRFRAPPTTAIPLRACAIRKAEANAPRPAPLPRAGMTGINRTASGTLWKTKSNRTMAANSERRSRHRMRASAWMHGWPSCGRTFRAH